MQINKGIVNSFLNLRELIWFPPGEGLILTPLVYLLSPLIRMYEQL